MSETTHRKRRLAQRSRTALAWGLAAFVVLQVGLSAAIAVWWPAMGDPDCDYKKQRLCQRHHQSGGRATAVWMLGSSRTALGFKGKELEERLGRETGRPVIAFNFGLTGAGPVTELVTLKRLLAEGIRPDLLLVEVLPPLLANHAPMPIEGHWLVAERLRLSEVSFLEGYGLDGKKLRRNWFVSWLVPWYTQRFNLLSRVLPAWLPWQVRKDWFRAVDDSGWVDFSPPVTTPEQYRQAVDRARQEYAPYLADFHLGGNACQALRDLLELCHREGISTALVMMPEGAEFRGLYPPGVWGQVQVFLDSLTREFGIPLINAREWIPDGDFSDSHHLRPHGATVFTGRLSGEVLGALRGPAKGRSPGQALSVQVSKRRAFRY
jgi:hypothetical protein